MDSRPWITFWRNSKLSIIFLVCERIKLKPRALLYHPTRPALVYVKTLNRRVSQSLVPARLLIIAMLLRQIRNFRATTTCLGGFAKVCDRTFYRILTLASSSCHFNVIKKHGVGENLDFCNLEGSVSSSVSITCTSMCGERCHLVNS